MALYEVQGPDGVVYEVEGPEGASDSQLINALQMHLGGTSVPPVPTPVSPPTSKRNPGYTRVQLYLQYTCTHIFACNGFRTRDGPSEISPALLQVKK